MLTELERLIEFRRQALRSDPLLLQPIPDAVVGLTITDDPVPATPPDHLADVVLLSDAQDDWLLRRLHADRVDDLLDWRLTWESSHTLGSIELLRGLHRFMSYAELYDDETEAIGNLLTFSKDEPSRSITPHELERYRLAVVAYVAMVRAAGTTAVALVDTSPTVERTGLVRAWAESMMTSEIVGRGTVVVGFSCNKLMLRFADDTRHSINDIRSYSIGAEGAVVVDGEGNSHVLDDDATDAIAALAPDVSSWRARQVPEVLVWAEFMDALNSATSESVLLDTPVSIQLGDERHAALSRAV